MPYCNGCRVLSTPGHTPGHISLYIAAFDTILSGDAVALEEGQPVLPNPQYSLEPARANTSMQRLLSHPAQRMICYHGGLFQKGTL